MKVYINYPNPHFTIHSDSKCNEFQKMEKPHQRVINITQETYISELENFDNKKYIFQPNQEHNDLWLIVNLGDYDKNLAFVQLVQLAIGKHYSPLASASIKKHC